MNVSADSIRFYQVEMYSDATTMLAFQLGTRVKGIHFAIVVLFKFEFIIGKYVSVLAATVTRIPFSRRFLPAIHLNFNLSERKQAPGLNWGQTADGVVRR